MMINKKLTFVLILFLGLSMVVTHIAVNVVGEDVGAQVLGDKDEFQEVTHFKGLKYFNSEGPIKKMSLEAEDLKIANSKELLFISPVGRYFKSEDTIDFQSASGHFDSVKKILTLNRDVMLKTQNGSTHKANFIRYNGQKNTFNAKGETSSKILNLESHDKFEVKSNSLSSNLHKKEIQFKGNVRATLIRNRNYEGKLALSADSMLLNQLESQAFFDGDVTLKRNKYYLHANKADLFLENFNKTLKYYVLYDDIKLEEVISLDDGSSIKRRAYSEKLEGYMREGKIVLSGAPRVEQGDDLIQGYQITLRENVELVEVDDSQTSFKIKKKGN